MEKIGVQLKIRLPSIKRVKSGAIELVISMWHVLLGTFIMFIGMLVGAAPRFIYYPEQPPTDAVYLYTTIASPIILYGLSWMRRKAWKIGADLKAEADNQALRDALANTTAELIASRKEFSAFRIEITDLRQEVGQLRDGISEREPLP